MDREEFSFSSRHQHRDCIRRGGIDKKTKKPTRAHSFEELSGRVLPCEAGKEEGWIGVSRSGWDIEATGKEAGAYTTPWESLLWPAYWSTEVRSAVLGDASCQGRLGMLSALRWLH